jgi:hypothetical protein
MAMYQSYVSAREHRDVERESFRATKDVEAVGSALEKVLGLLGNEIPSERAEERERK